MMQEVGHLHKGNIKMKLKFNHTNLLNGFLPNAAGIDTVESTLRSPIDGGGRCFSNTFCEAEAEAESLLDPLFHLKEPMLGARGNENLLFDVWLPGVPGALSFRLLVAGLTFAIAETVGDM